MSKQWTPKWGAGADGPYIDAQEFIDWLNSEAARLKGVKTSTGDVTAEVIENVCSVVTAWTALMTKRRLELIVSSNLTPDQLDDLRDDLVGLHQELGKRE